MRALKNKKNSKLPSWHLKDLYTENSPKLQSDLKRLSNQVASFNTQFKGQIIKLNPKKLYQVIKSYEEISALASKIRSFAFLNYVTDVNDHKRKALLQSIDENINQITEQLIFFQLELNKIDEKKLTKAFLQNQDLADYKPWLKKVRVWKKYELNEIEEKILLQKDLTSNSAWIKFYDQQKARLRFNFKNKSMNFAEIIEYLSSSSEKDRKNAALSISKVFNENAETFTFIYNTIVKDKELDDKRRGFKKPISARNLSNYIDDKIVDTLIDTVKANYPKLSHRYYKIKAKLMGKKYLNYWDRNAPIVMGQETNIPWHEAVEIVLGGYKKFSTKFYTIGKQFFDNNWIDARVLPNKMYGAFAHPTTTLAHPYIMLNYQNKNRDVMTLAHELGHGVHQVLAASQGELMSQTPLTLAETASVFGEQLIFRSLLERERNPKKRKLLIASKVEDMLNTVVRQTALCEFERRFHDARKTRELSYQEASAIWLSTQEETFGKYIQTDESYNPFWMYIPHFFHSPFYVYAYAFGDCLVNSLYSLYEQGKVKNFEEKYIAMLTAGGNFDYKDLKTTFGLDPYKADFWQQGLNKISELIDLLEKN